MRNIIIISLLCLFSSCVTENINTVLSTHELHEIRLRKLKDFCAKINEEILAIKLIINADWGETDYITDLQATSEGYRITFAKGGNVTIYNGLKGDTGNKGENGQDGIDGTNGENGVDGSNGLNAPIIGVQKHTDDIYYWTTTINGTTTWLLGEDGEKLAVNGVKGDTGAAGKPGEPGIDGTLPQLSVDADGYWTINNIRLLHNGQPVPATGPQGTQGDPGKDQTETGAGGDLLVKEVLPKTDSVIFILTSNNLRFAVPRPSPVTLQINSITNGSFYFGQTLTIDFTCTGVTEVTAIVPTGWNAITDFAARKVIVSAPSENDLYGDREGELTLISGNPQGYSITANLKVYAVKAYQVTNWNFTDSRVYHVLNPQGTKIAEVCTEYIPGYSETQQAIVVYPYDIQTQTYGKGFVVNGGGDVLHDGSQYAGKGQDGTAYATVYVTYRGISTQEPTEYTSTYQKPDVLKDADGNLYPITKIGKQYWTTRNWSATHYMDGSSIILETDLSKWNQTNDEPHYTYPNNDPTLQKTYGLVYNMFAIKTGKLFPEGWDIPTSDPLTGDNDCQDLFDYLGTNDGLKLKSTRWGNNLAQGEWIPSGNNQGNNISGFNAFPGGYSVTSEYRSMGEFSILWTSSYRWNDNQYVASYNTMDLRNYMSTALSNSLSLVDFWGCYIRLIRKD